MQETFRRLFWHEMQEIVRTDAQIICSSIRLNWILLQRYPNIYVKTNAEGGTIFIEGKDAKDTPMLDFTTVKNPPITYESENLLTDTKCIVS